MSAVVNYASVMVGFKGSEYPPWPNYFVVFGFGGLVRTYNLRSL